MTATHGHSAPTLAVELGHGSDTTRDASILAGAYLSHALAAATWPPAAPTSRDLRHRLPGWSRCRFSAALRDLAPQLTTRPDGSRHLAVTVPDGASGLLLADAYAPRPFHRRDCARIRLWLDEDRWADHRQFLADLDALGHPNGYARLVIELGEATTPHPWIIHDLREAVAAGLPTPEFEGPQFAVIEAWRRAYAGRN